MLVAMAIAASLCVFIGIFPWILYDILPYRNEYTPFDTSHILAQIQLLIFSAAAFAWLQVSGIYPPELKSTNLDVDWFFRKPAFNFIIHVRNALVSLKKISLEIKSLCWENTKSVVIKHYTTYTT